MRYSGGFPPPHPNVESQGKCPGNRPSCFPCIDQERNQEGIQAMPPPPRSLASFTQATAQTIKPNTCPRPSGEQDETPPSCFYFSLSSFSSYWFSTWKSSKKEQRKRNKLFKYTFSLDFFFLFLKSLKKRETGKNKDKLMITNDLIFTPWKKGIICWKEIIGD